MTSYADPANGQVNAQNFGADPTGRVDLCAHSWKEAVNALPKSGGVIVFPAGTFTASCRLQIVDRPIRLIGAGAGATTITFVGKVGGISIIEPSADEPAEIASMSLKTASANSGEAVSIAYAHFSSAQHGPSLHDLDIRGASPGQFWSQGVVLSNAGYAAIRDVTVKGETPVSSTGLDRATSTGECFVLNATSVGVALDHNLCLYADIGIKLRGDAEGAKVHGNELVAVNTGLDAQGGDGRRIAGPPSVIFSDNHVNSYHIGARLAGWAQVQSHGNLLYKTSASSLDWTGFWLADVSIAGAAIGSNLGNYSGDILYGFRGSAAGGLAQAFSIGALATNNFIHGETAEAMDHFADEGNGTGPNRISGNFAPDLGSDWFRNINAHVIAFGNTPQSDKK